MPPRATISRDTLEQHYTQYNQRSFVHPDPLEFLYRYKDPSDREIVGLIAASLAYGRVHQILKSVEIVLQKLGPSPSAFLKETPHRSLAGHYRHFRHRFTDGRDLVALLDGITRVIHCHGSLENYVAKHALLEHKTLTPALLSLCDAVVPGGNSLIPVHTSRSACKRMHLFMRWMIRHDAVDPGGWTELSPAQLVIPLDTHMIQIGHMLKLTTRKSPDIVMAEDITTFFRTVCPEDPVKYDFALTRFGIRPELTRENILEPA